MPLSAGVVGSEPRANNWRIMSLQVQIAERGGGGGGVSVTGVDNQCCNGAMPGGAG